MGTPKHTLSRFFHQSRETGTWLGIESNLFRVSLLGAKLSQFWKQSSGKWVYSVTKVHVATCLRSKYSEGSRESKRDDLILISVLTYNKA